MNKEFTDVGVENLCAAIVLQAVKDYARDINYLERKVSQKKLDSKSLLALTTRYDNLKATRKFFNDEGSKNNPIQMSFITNMDGERIYKTIESKYKFNEYEPVILHIIEKYKEELKRLNRQYGKDIKGYEKIQKEIIKFSISPSSI